jgi:hypothetical protein
MITYSEDAINASINAITTLIDASATPGKFLFYTAGFTTSLAVSSCSQPAFNPADNGSANLVAATTTALVLASGTVAKFRLVDGDGEIILEGDIGLPGSGADLTFENLAWETGDPISVSNFTLSAGA